MASPYRLTELRTKDGYFVYVDPTTGDIAREDWAGYLVPIPEEQLRDLAAPIAALQGSYRHPSP